MNIIFGDLVKNIPDSFTVLELDTFKDPDTGLCATAYCVPTATPLHELSTLQAYKDTHDHLIKEYKKKNWEYCRCAIKELRGRWNGELDTFYDDLERRIDQFALMSLDDSWDGLLTGGEKFP
jgi:hypothetical protein